MKLSTIGCVAGVPRPKPVAQECVGSQLPAEPPGKTARKRWEPPPARQYQAGRLARLALPAERRGQQLAGSRNCRVYRCTITLFICIVDGVGKLRPPMRKPSIHGKVASRTNPPAPTLSPNRTKVCALPENAHVHALVAREPLSCLVGDIR